MADNAKRPTLHLKFARAAAETAIPPASDWKCRPCGKSFQVDGGLDGDAAVRCPSCNARLGLAREFRQTPPSPKLRARPLGET
jgi:DNA-directed RNA polymerase subunit RPC12/RpoP